MEEDNLISVAVTPFSGGAGTGTGAGAVFGLLDPALLLLLVAASIFPFPLSIIDIITD